MVEKHLGIRAEVYTLTDLRGRDVYETRKPRQRAADRRNKNRIEAGRPVLAIPVS